MENEGDVVLSKTDFKGSDCVLEFTNGQIPCFAHGSKTPANTYYTVSTS